MHYITEKDVEQNLGMKETVDVLEDAFSSYASGQAFYRPRERIAFNGTVFNTMPGVYEKHHLAGLKTYIANRNGARFVVVIFDTMKSELVAVIEANKLGQVRTGALPAMVTRKIVEGGSHSLCIVGSGYQAETQLEGIHSVFDLDAVSVYSKTFGNAKKFAEKMSKKLGIDVKAFDDVRAALKDVTIINSITDSNDSIFSRQDLGNEYHVNLCGGNRPDRREAADDVFLESDMVIVEDIEQAMKESGEIISLARNHPSRECLQLGDLWKMEKSEYFGKGKTVFKSMGIGLEDVAAAYVLLRNMNII